MLESRSAQTNDDRGGSGRAGRCRHRRARAGAERWRLARGSAHDLGSAAARLHLAGVPADHGTAHVAAHHAGVPADDRTAAAELHQAGVPADHVGPADPAADDPAVPADDLDAAVAELLDPDDAAGHVDPGPVRSHR
jgi:hypothetical protein